MIHKVNKSKIINKKNPKFKSDRLNDILPYLPNKDLFFDSRHLNYGFTNDILPFSLTARIDNGQQYLKIMDKNTINEKEPIIYDDYNSKIANDQDCIGTITTQTGNSAPRHSYKIIEPTIVDDTYKNRDARLYNEVSPTLRSEREGLKVVEPNIINNKIKDEQDYERNSREILCILSQEINKKAIQRSFRRLHSFFEKEILRQRMYEKSICENSTESGLFFGTSFCEETEIFDNERRKNMCDLWFDKKCGCSSQRWEFSKQFTRELNIALSELSYEGASKIKTKMRNMRKTYKGAWTLQQTLSTLEEIWESFNGESQNSYRIRKLTPRECFRLQGVDDTDIDKIQSAGISNSQQYKLAGNSIVVDVLYHIFRKMFIDKDCESDQLSLF